MKNRNAERRGMKTKVEFYKAFFEELEKKGFGVAQPSSPDYVVDIQFKGKTIAFYTKVDMIEKNPFVEVPEKQMERLGAWQGQPPAYAVSVPTSLTRRKRLRN